MTGEVRRYSAGTPRPLVIRRPLATLAVVGGLFGVVVALRLWLRGGGHFPGDRWAARRLISHPHHPEWLAHVAQVYAALASPGSAIGVTVVAALLAVGWAGARGGLSMIFSAVVVPVNFALKHLWGATRPFTMAVPHSHNLNYPSGHVSYAVSVFGFLGVLAWRARWRGLALLCALAAVGMGPARIMSDAHLVSDCVGGYALGFGWLLLTLWLPAMTEVAGEWAILGSNQ